MSVSGKEKRFVKKKHTSLFVMSVSDKEKLFFNNKHSNLFVLGVSNKEKGGEGYSISKWR